MTDWAARNKLQLARITAALLLGKTPLLGELLLDTTNFYVVLGDGSTAGGNGVLIPVRGGELDIGAALFRGNSMNLAAGATISGAVVLGQTLTQTASAGLCYHTLFCLTASDADGGRPAGLMMGGLTAAAAQHYLAILRAEHDGAGADQKGRVVFIVNTGADGLAPTTEAFRVDSLGIQVPSGMFARGVDRIWEGYGDSGVALSTGSAASLTWTNAFADTGFSTPSSSEVQCNFAGTVEVRWSCTFSIGNAARIVTEIDCWMEQWNGSSWSEVAGSRRAEEVDYTVSGPNKSTIAGGRVLTVASGDKIRLRAQITNGVPTSANANGTRRDLFVRRLAR